MGGRVRRARRVSERGTEASDAAPGVVASSSHPSAEAVAQRNAEFSRLAVLLPELPDRQRELLALKYGAELTNRAIAGMTGLSESSVGTILHRVIVRLRARWEVGHG